METEQRRVNMESDGAGEKSIKRTVSNLTNMRPTAQDLSDHLLLFFHERMAAYAIKR